ncbi:PREDICTED: UPF0553 protein C9orf64-like [Trachymyrmex septentrionalis]|uniref:UPF0553 protein C9orf64-like n=1 Tax=Trachymyrmex septentrionalis TaxID=34720 RepID=UPI00084F0D5F|nr:PREDICTED: UPF0553 protein C9orf64-like [Trachymyrmex septentrionalis]
MQSKNKHDIDTLQYVASLSKAVSINTKKIKELATEIVAYASRNHLNENFNEVARSYVRLSTEFHPDKDDKRAADWLFVLNTLNFALWTRKNMKEWKVDGFTGYMALCVAIKKAIDDGKPMWDPKFYTKLKVGEMVQIFKGDDNIIMPHILRRLTILQEVGKVLLDRYDGSFANCIKLCKGNSIELMINIHHVFPSYHDVIKYCEREVCLYTKARTLISDIWAYFDKEHELWIEMKGTKHSTIFADYRIFQVFHHFNVLVYNKEFFDLLEKEEFITHGCREEVEIRCCSLLIIRYLRKTVMEMLPNLKRIPKSEWSGFDCACLIDNFLWDHLQQNIGQLKKNVLCKVRTESY